MPNLHLIRSSRSGGDYLNWFPTFVWWTFDYTDIKLRTETMQLVTEASHKNKSSR